MRYFKLRSSDPLFNEESLQLLKTMQVSYNPALSLELRDYLDTQAQFIVSVAKQYRTNSTGWAGLLAAGQLTFVQAWQEHIAEQKEIDRMVTFSVREAIIAAVTAQFVATAPAESPYRWALDAGEHEEMAIAFAEYYRKKSAHFEQEMAEQITQINAKAPADDEEAASVLDDLAQVETEIAEIAPTVLSWAWFYIEKYKAALAKGHSPEWADTYADHFGLTNEEAASAQEAYDQLREKYPTRKGRVNEAVYQEAYRARLDRGEDYAAAYGKEVGMGEFTTADAYAKAFVEMRRAGKSELLANYYASAVADDIVPKYAELEAELYEQALAGGMTDGLAREYADRLSTNLIEHAETDEDKAYYTQEAAEYIAGKQQKP